MKGHFWRSEASHRRVNSPNRKLLRHRKPDLTMMTTRILMALCACLCLAAVQAGSVQRLGCFIDAADRDLPELLNDNRASRSFCLNFCEEKGYRYFGLQAGNWCACGNSYGKHGQASDTQCNMNCAGNSNETCGACLRNEIFTTGLWPQPGQRLGCFIDAADRDLPELLGDSRASRSFCLNFCKEKGYRYFGLQAGTWCTCGNSYGKHGQTSDTACNMNCAGNSSETCGAGLRNEIFTTGLRSQTGQRLGCFVDAADRDLPVLLNDNRASRSFCLGYCGDKGYSYFGLQAGTWCTCGNSYGKHGNASNAECSMNCAGNSSETCGGGLRNEIFPTSLIFRAGKRIGCFVDAADRDLPVLLNDNRASRSFCLGYCENKGYRYFGLQAGTWCTCGNSFGKHGSASDTACNMNCAGNSSETCGGGLRNEIFTTGLN